MPNCSSESSLQITQLDEDQRGSASTEAVLLTVLVLTVAGAIAPIILEMTSSYFARVALVVSTPYP